MKTCSRCGETKALADFNRASDHRDGLQSYCRGCNKEISRNRQVRQWGILRAHVWSYLASHPCVDCGEVDPVVLEFDHVRGEKIEGIGKMISQAVTLAKLEAEIAKCEVRCANCHRRRTANVGGWWKIGRSA